MIGFGWFRCNRFLSHIHGVYTYIFALFLMATGKTRINLAFGVRIKITNWSLAWAVDSFIQKMWKELNLNYSMSAAGPSIRCRWRNPFQTKNHKNDEHFWLKTPRSWKWRRRCVCNDVGPKLKRQIKSKKRRRNALSHSAVKRSNWSG